MTTPRTEKRCRICGQAHWRAPAGWIADHISEPVDFPIEAEAAAPDVEALDVERLRRAIDATRDRSVSLDPITIAAEYARLLKGSGDPR